MNNKRKVIYDVLPAFFILVGGVILWEILEKQGKLPRFIIPSPSDIMKVFQTDGETLWKNSWVTLVQAWIGLGIGVMLAFILAIIMDMMGWVNRAVYPLLIISQTVPTVAIAPILVLSLGYGMAPKIVLVVLTTLFPIVIALLNGFSHTDQEAVQLLELMGANRWQILFHVKLPASLPYFFSGLKVSVSYAFVSSLVAEWLGGFEGLGVYMIQSRKAFSYDKMFAVIVLISVLSLLFMGLVSLVQGRALPWLYRDKK